VGSKRHLPIPATRFHFCHHARDGSSRTTLRPLRAACGRAIWTVVTDGRWWCWTLHTHYWTTPRATLRAPHRTDTVDSYTDVLFGCAPSPQFRFPPSPSVRNSSPLTHAHRWNTTNVLVGPDTPGWFLTAFSFLRTTITHGFTTPPLDSHTTRNTFTRLQHTFFCDSMAPVDIAYIPDSDAQLRC